MRVHVLRLHHGRRIIKCLVLYVQSMLTDDDMDRLPIVYFRETPFTQLESLLQFIYSGRTQVTTSDLNSFMQLAYGLGIKGFADKQVVSISIVKVCA